MSPSLKYDVVPVAEVPADEIVIVTPRKPVVLVVDDERVIADTLSIILSQSGFVAVTAYDGAMALNMAKDVSPDLVLSDVVMPGMTGVDLAIAVTQIHPACKILLFSGQAATVDLLEKARSLGHDFTTLTKPVHPTDMLRRIQECLAPQKSALPAAKDSPKPIAQFAS